MSARIPCSVFLPQVGLSYVALRERAHQVEQAGYEGLWVVDHMWGRGAPDLPCLEGWSLVAALSEATTRLRLGVLVSCNSYRNPGMLAKAVVTADHVSGGRVELGLGAGWMEEEYRAYGFDFQGIRVRLAQLEEALKIITSLFSRRRASVQGKYHRVLDAPFEPKPLQAQLPITIGGSGPRVLMNLVARYAQRWNCPMPAAARLEEHLRALAVHCESIGRDPREIAVSEQVAVVIGKDDATLRAKLQLAQSLIGGFVDIPNMAICGTPQSVVDQLAAKMRRGVGDFAILFGDMAAADSLELFATRVHPQLMPT